MREREREREEEYTFCYFLVMHFDAEICLAICCSPTGLEGKKKYFFVIKKRFHSEFVV